MGFFNSIFGKIIIGIGLIASAFIPGLPGVLAPILFGLGLSVASSAFTKPPGLDDFDNSARARLESFVDPNPPRRIVYGRVRTGGPIVYIAKSGAAGQYLHAVYYISEGEVENTAEKIFIGDEEVTVDGAGLGTGKWLDHVRLNKHPGTDAQTADADLVAEVTEWTTNHRGRGCAYNYLRLKFNPDLFPSGANTLLKISFIVQGRKVFDPRTSTTVYSDNPSLFIRDLKTDTEDGLAIPTAKIDDATSADTFWIAANDCEDAITLKAGGTEERYAGGGVYVTSQRPSAVLQQMLSAMAGQLVYAGGMYRLYAAKWRAPTVSFDEDDLRGPITITSNIPRPQLFNAVRGTFANAAGDLFQPVDFPPVTNSAYATEDGSTIFTDISLPYTTSSPTAQRLAKIHLERTRQPFTVESRFGLRALQVQPPDVMQFSYARTSFTEKAFEISPQQLVIEPNAEGIPEIQVGLTLRETASTVYDWDETTEENDALVPSDPTVPDITTVATITGLAVAWTETTALGGIKLLAGDLSWTAIADQSVLQSGKIEIQWQPNAAGTWPNAQFQPGAAASAALRGFTDGSAYDFRVRGINGAGVKGAWTTITNKTAAGTAATFSGTVSSLDNVNDGATYKRVTADEKTGAGYGFTNIRSDGTYTDPRKFHKSGVRDLSTTTVGGLTTIGTWTTVDSYVVTLSPGTTRFDCTLSVTVAPGPSTAWTGKGRIKIGASTSAEVVVTNPATSNSAAVAITGLTGDTSVTVEVQAERTVALPIGASVDSRFTRQDPSYHDQSHWTA